MTSVLQVIFVSYLKVNLSPIYFVSAVYLLIPKLGYVSLFAKLPKTMLAEMLEVFITFGY